MHSQKMQALGTLAAGIAHDFNNLLSVIRMSNQLIARTVKDNAEVKEYTTDIEKALRCRATWNWCVPCLDMRGMRVLPTSRWT